MIYRRKCNFLLLEVFLKGDNSELDRGECICSHAFLKGGGSGGQHNPTTECGFRQNHLRFVARDS